MELNVRQDKRDGLTVFDGGGQPDADNPKPDLKLVRDDVLLSASTPQVFGLAGPAMRRAGFAVMPATGKKPRKAGFSRWPHAPSLTVVERWAAQEPEADLVYVPGLSRTKNNPEGLVVVDADDDGACVKVVELFGETPGKVKTRRGKHYLYSDSGGSLGKIQSLKKLGINADVKHGRTIVVAPPSHHENDNDFVYSWDSCDETVIRDLPPFNARALQGLIEAQSPGWNLQPNVTTTAPPASAHREALHEGSRGLGLNKFLCGHAWACESFEALLDCAQTYNSNIVNKGFAALESSEIMARTAAVWKDLQEGKLERWHNLPAVARTDADEIKDLCGRSKHGGDAVALLLLLRAKHYGRTLRGETFALNVRATAESKTLDWTIERFRNAIKVLLGAGFLKIVTHGQNSRTGRRATQYTLVPRQLLAFAQPD